MEIRPGRLASPQVEWEKLPSPAALEPLVVVREADTPAAEDAALQLALLETGR